MRKLGLALFLQLGLVGLAQAASGTMPPPAGVIVNAYDNGSGWQSVTTGTGMPVVCESGCASPAPPSLGGNASLSVSGSTGNVAFPASTSSYPAAIITNDGTNELFYALGNSGVTATTSSAALPAGYQVCLATGTNTNVAGITSSSTTTLRITQVSSCASISGGGSGGSSWSNSNKVIVWDGSNNLFTSGNAAYVQFPSTQSVNDASMGGTAISSNCVTTYGSAPVSGACPSVNAFITGGTLGPTVTGNALVKGTTSAMTGTSSTQVIAAVSSQHIYVTAFHCNNSSSTATLVTMQDGSGGTTLDTIICPAGGGDERNGGGFPMFWTTAGNALYAADVTTGASVIVQASGYSSAN